MIKRTIHPMGEDHVILITGGDAHIGSHVTAIPYQKDGKWQVTLQTWNQLSHKDDEIAKRYASAFSLMSHHVTVCICGIHFDDITKDAITEVIAWCEQDIEQMRKEWNNE